jgi:hypothetical protein
LTRRRECCIGSAAVQSLEVHPGPWRDAFPRFGACRSLPADSCAIFHTWLRSAREDDRRRFLRLADWFVAHQAHDGCCSGRRASLPRESHGPKKEPPM